MTKSKKEIIVSANDLPIYLRGQVVKGYGRGSKQLGIPTANLDSEAVNALTIPNGVYYGLAQIEFKDDSNQLKLSPIYKMVANLGICPQFNNPTPSLEVHIMHKFDQDFYGATLRTLICGHIREEMKFDSLQALIDQIWADIRYADEQLDESLNRLRYELLFSSEPNETLSEEYRKYFVSQTSSTLASVS